MRKIAESNEEVRKMLAAGEMVPDKEMTSYLTAFFDSQNLYDDIIFDGFPRNLPQYNFLKKWLKQRMIKIDLVIILNISDQEAVKRLLARRVDPATGKVYNLVTDPPPSNVDLAKLIRREDDNPVAIKRRLELYKNSTRPLINQLKKETRVVEINGERPIKDIAADIEKLIIK